MIRLAAILLICLAPFRAAAEDVRADLELILAVDASGSVNEREFGLQMGGIARAFLDTEVVSAARGGPEGRIAVALLIWSDAALPKTASEWFLIDGPEAAAAFSDRVASFIPQRGVSIGQSGAGTGIGAALEFALAMFPANGVSAPRRTIDLSGDGVETKPWFQKATELPAARAMAAAAGVTVNGLAILSDDRRLGAYYRAEMITGPGSFVMEAAGFEDFAEAIKLKLLAEIWVVASELDARHR